MSFKLKPCAFQKWAQFDSWPIRQTAFVLLGHEPPPLADLFPASNNDYLDSRLTWGDLFDGIVDQEPFFDLKRIDPTEGSALLDMARMLDLAVQNNNIPWKRLIENRFSVIHVKPTDVLVWARNKKFAIPPELIALFPERLNSDFVALPVQVSAQKTYPINEMIGSSTSSLPKEKDLHNRSEDTYLKVINALLCLQYGTWTHSDYSEFARQLRRDFDQAGITFNMEEKNRPLITILKKLEE